MSTLNINGTLASDAFSVLFGLIPSYGDAFMIMTSHLNDSF